MSRNHNQALYEINTALAIRRGLDADPVMLELDGRPIMHIEQFEPVFTGQAYGRLLNKAPHIVGRYALHSFSSAAFGNGPSFVTANVESVIGGYAMPVAPFLANQVAKYVGIDARLR